MSKFAWCHEGRHEGTKPKYSKPCPGTAAGRVCDCDCHQPAEPRFKRKKKDQ